MGVKIHVLSSLENDKTFQIKYSQSSLQTVRHCSRAIVIIIFHRKFLPLVWILDVLTWYSVDT